VNSLQIVSLKYWKQYLPNLCSWSNSCEFLTNCIFEVLKTVLRRYIHSGNKLWIPYKLYLWSIENSMFWFHLRTFVVVNSLQIVSLKYWKQYKNVCFGTAARCEFLTNCIFEVLKTVEQFLIKLPNSCEFLTNCIFEVLKTVLYILFCSSIKLWIPYKLYLWSIENSDLGSLGNWERVVNSLQIVSLKYWKQWIMCKTNVYQCCEFLTNCIFEVLKTVEN